MKSGGHSSNKSEDSQDPKISRRNALKLGAGLTGLAATGAGGYTLWRDGVPDFSNRENVGKYVSEDNPSMREEIIGQLPHPEEIDLGLVPRDIDGNRYSIEFESDILETIDMDKELNNRVFYDGRPISDFAPQRDVIAYASTDKAGNIVYVEDFDAVMDAVDEELERNSRQVENFTVYQDIMDLRIPGMGIEEARVTMGLNPDKEIIVEAKNTTVVEDENSSNSLASFDRVEIMAKAINGDVRTLDEAISDYMDTELFERDKFVENIGGAPVSGAANAYKDQHQTNEARINASDGYLAIPTVPGQNGGVKMIVESFGDIDDSLEETTSYSPAERFRKEVPDYVGRG